MNKTPQKYYNHLAISVVLLVLNALSPLDFYIVPMFTFLIFTLPSLKEAAETICYRAHLMEASMAHPSIGTFLDKNY